VIDSLRLYNLHLSSFLSSRLVLITLTLFVLLWGFIGLDLFGVHIPLLRGLIGLIFLTVIPGMIVIRIIKVNLNQIESFLYSVGISLIILMMLGLLLNIFLPIFGVLNPISLIPLITSISVVTISLLVILYFSKYESVAKNCIDIQKLISDEAYLVIMGIIIFTFSVLGSYIVNTFNSSVILMVMLLLIVFYFFLLNRSKDISIIVCCFALFTISVSLLLHHSLISQYLTGWDVIAEYHYASDVIANAIWNPSYGINLEFANYNLVLSVSILPAIFSCILDIDLVWVYKVIFPLLFSLVPISLFFAFYYQTNKKMALFSVIYIITIVTFFTELLALPRQEIAELFFSLILLTIVSPNLSRKEKGIFYTVFFLGLVVSHYTTTFLVLILFLGVYLLSLLIKQEQRIINLDLILVSFILSFTYYAYLYYDIVLRNGITTITHFLTQGQSEMFQSPAVNLIVQTSPYISDILLKSLLLISQLLIVIGVLCEAVRYIKKSTSSTFNVQFLILAILGLAVLLPSLISSVGVRIQRIFHIVSLFLAPFFVIGALNVIPVGNYLFKRSISKERIYTISFNFITIFLAIFLLFNSGFVNELFHDRPKSISLSQKTVDEFGTTEEVYNFYYNNLIFTEYDMYGATWIKSVEISPDSPIYADAVIVDYLLLYYNDMQNGKYITGLPNSNSYIFLGDVNTKTGILFSPSYDNLSIVPITYSANHIYSNGHCNIFQVPPMH
jgi:uncharacterized membrane protein